MKKYQELSKRVVELVGGKENVSKLTHCVTRLRFIVKDKSLLQEAEIKKLPGVNSATVSFMTQKLTLDADDARFDEILQQVVKVCKKVEPDCTILVK